MESLLLIVSLAAVAGAGARFLTLGEGNGRRLVLPVTTIAIAIVTTAVSVAGNLWPSVLDALARNRELLLDGQWWRLFTPLLVQDGAWAGTVFNLVGLLIVGTLAETLHGGRILLAVYLSAGVVSEIAAYTLLQHQGFAGNSVAVGGVTALCLVRLSAPPLSLTQALSALGLLAGTVLLVSGNLHGVGFAVGVLFGVALAVFRSNPRSATHDRRAGEPGA